MIGSLITLDRLPHPHARLTPGRKAEIVLAIHHNTVTRAQVIDRYGLSAAELFAWETGFHVHGQPGLAVGRMQEFRRHG